MAKAKTTILHEHPTYPVKIIQNGDASVYVVCDERPGGECVAVETEAELQELLATGQVLDGGSKLPKVLARGTFDQLSAIEE